MDDNPYASFGGAGARAAFDVDSSAVTLRATFTLDRATVHRALRLHVARNRRVRWFANLVVLVVAPLLLLVKPGQPLAPAIFLVLALITLNCPPFFYVLSSFSLLLMRVGATGGVFCQHIIEVKDGEFVESTDVNRSAVRLKAIADIHQDDGLLVITLPGGGFVPIPESADFGPDSFDTFCLKLRAAVDAAKASANNQGGSRSS